MNSWIPIEKVKDDDIFVRGTAFKFLPTEEGKKIGHYIPENGLDYILSCVPGKRVMHLICLSIGEEGNALLCELKENSRNSRGVTGKEVKSMLMSKIQRVLINKNCTYIINN